MAPASNSLPYHAVHWGVVYACPGCGEIVLDGVIPKAEYPTPPDRILCTAPRHTPMEATRKVTAPAVVGPVWSTLEAYQAALGDPTLTTKSKIDRALQDKGHEIATDKQLRDTHELGMSHLEAAERARKEGALNDGDPVPLERVRVIAAVSQAASGMPNTETARRAAENVIGAAVDRVRNPQEHSMINQVLGSANAAIVPETPREAQALQVANTIKESVYGRARGVDEIGGIQ